MRSQAFWIVLVISAEAIDPLRADSARNASEQRIARLIDQLGDKRYPHRETAGRELIAIGEPALPALRLALEHPNLEVRRRSRYAIRAIMLAATTSRSTQMRFVLIDAGTFEMGSKRNESYRRPDELQHTVRITKPFLLGIHEVSQAEYARVLKTNPSWFSSTGAGKDKVAKLAVDRFPVENVSWFDAVQFCNRLSEIDGYAPCYKLTGVRKQDGSIVSGVVSWIGGSGYRLPTEAEWEFACRGFTATRFHYGYSNTGREANLRPGPATGYGAPPNWETLERTCKVGSYKPNFHGLYDMHGNVAEWCWDWYDKDYYSIAPVRNPIGADRGHHRVLRGGSWLVNETNCRSASRAYLAPDQKTYYAGFRVARTP